MIAHVVIVLLHSTMATYSIKEISLLTGILPHTLRVWEQRYGIFSPNRTESNIRRYTDDDLRLALNIVYLQGIGYRISRIARLSPEEIGEIISKGTRYLSSSPAPETLLVHAKNLETTQFEKLVKEYVKHKGIEWAFENVFIPFQVLMGQLWQAGTINVTHEHFSICILRNALVAETFALEPKISNTLRVLFFLPEEEFHDLTLLYYSYIARKAGAQVLYLGQNIPLNEIKHIVSQKRYTHLFTAITAVRLGTALGSYFHDLTKLTNHIPVFAVGKPITQHLNRLPANVIPINNAEQFRELLAESSLNPDKH